MLVDCVSTKYSLQELARRGLEQNAAGLNLFNYQVVFLDRDPSDLLPQAIPLDLESDTASADLRGSSQNA